MNLADLSLVVSITMTCYSWATSTGDHFVHMWCHLQITTPPLAIRLGDI